MTVFVCMDFERMRLTRYSTYRPPELGERTKVAGQPPQRVFLTHEGEFAAVTRADNFGPIIGAMRAGIPDCKVA